MREDIQMFHRSELIVENHLRGAIDEKVGYLGLVRTNEEIAVFDYHVCTGGAVSQASDHLEKICLLRTIVAN